MMQKESSVAVESVQKPNLDQFSVPTWGIVVSLIIAMVILKSFIYIKDVKRHGK